MNVKIETNLSECQKLWETFSPKQSLWEDWDVACSFLDETITPHFIVWENGILPLQKELRKGVEKYYFFGSEYPENLTFWFPIEEFQKILPHIPTPTKIFDMNEKQVQQIIEKNPDVAKHFQNTDTHFFIDTKKTPTIQDYLQTFSQKHRKNLLYDLRKVDQYKESWDGIEQYEKLVELSIERFKEASDFADTRFVTQFKRLLQVIYKKNELHVLTIRDDNDAILGVEIGAFHKSTYYVLNGASNHEVKNIGKKLIFAHINKAFECGAQTIDFLVGDTGGWKDLWNLEQQTVINFEKE